VNLADIFRGQYPPPPSDADLESAAARILIGNQGRLIELCGAARALVELATQTINAPRGTP
jgi:hypothetical protein